MVAEVFILLILSMETWCWNIDTKFPLTFHSFKKSYFGFSVALHENDQGPFALVSAPRGNSTVKLRATLHQPGVLYNCSIVSTECSEIPLETRASTIADEYQSKEDDMWLGVSLDVQPEGLGYIITCGHLWKNQLYSFHYLTNGVCYLIDKNLNMATRTRLLPFVDKNKQSLKDGIYYHAFAQGGISATFSEDGSELLIGAPGFYDWIGGVASYNIKGKFDPESKPIIPDPPGDHHPTAEAYIGYSVTTGKFFKSGNMQFVAGAPRDGSNRGRVYIFEELNEYQNTIRVLQKKEGEKVGEYFGATVLGLDANNDGNTDLLVGAPFYSYQHANEGGKVYVYISNGLGFEQVPDLFGKMKFRSRFGTSLANAGDVNQDGYLDVAIGAPYEDDKGVIYVYHGTRSGYIHHLYQRITAEEINPKLSGFGISISRGKDIDGNDYPDILIGSYVSDLAVLLRSRPIVELFGNIFFHPEQINTNISNCFLENQELPCFNTSYCLRYTGNHVPLTLGVSIELRSFRKKDTLQPRRYLIHNSALSSYLRENVILQKEKPECFPHLSFVTGDSEDFITPIQMNLKYWLTYDVKTEKKFCKRCPMLNPKIPNSSQRIITFQIGCGEDTKCHSDLKLNSYLSGLSSGMIILGESKTITLTIEVKNTKEPAYMTELQIEIPRDLQVINPDSCRQSEEPTEQMILLCHVGNPFKRNRTAKFNIKLDTSLISTDLDYLTLNATVTTASEEVNPDDNFLNFTIPLKVLADIYIIGQPGKEQIVLGKDYDGSETADFDHIYTALKTLPSTIHSASVEISIPTTFLDTDIEFIQLTSVQINEPGKSGSSVPASCNVSLINLLPESAEFEQDKEVQLDIDLQIQTPTPKRKRSVDSVQSPQVNSLKTSTTKNDLYANPILNCTTSICKQIVCAAGPFTQKSRSATFHIYGFINLTALQQVLPSWDNISVISNGRVSILDAKKDIQPLNHNPDETKVTTILIQSIPLPPKKVANWIIAVSVGCGILLLVLILLGLIKLGFFKRKKKEDMKKLMMQAQLQEWEPYMVTDEDAEKHH